MDQAWKSIPNVTTNKELAEIISKSENETRELYMRYKENRAVDEPAYSILIVMYVILITVGALGNILVVSETSLPD